MNEILGFKMCLFSSIIAHPGRMYLSMIPSLLRFLLDCLRTEEKESVTRENVLAALQKLSLRYAVLSCCAQGDKHVDTQKNCERDSSPKNEFSPSDSSKPVYVFLFC